MVYGSTPHLVTNYLGEKVDAKPTTDNVHETKPIPDIIKKLSSTLYAEKGYISKKLSEKLSNYRFIKPSIVDFGFYKIGTLFPPNAMLYLEISVEAIAKYVSLPS